MCHARRIYETEVVKDGYDPLQQAMQHLPEERRVSFMDWTKKPIQRALGLKMFADQMCKHVQDESLHMWSSQCDQVMFACDDVVKQLEPKQTPPNPTLKSSLLKGWKSSLKSLKGSSATSL
jgi:hypothetical protein